MKLLSRITLRKVPQVTVYFWLVKILSTAMGEATSDYSVHQVDPVFAVILGFIGFVIAIAWQLKVKRYIPGTYWLTVVMVAVFGTMAADVTHIVLGIPYAISATFFSVALLALFALWYLTERTLSIHSIFTLRRELFYWATVLCTFALGTATGDLTAYTLQLGFLASGIMFAAAFAIPALAYRFFKLNPVIAFWLAYIVTRPLGASFADWMGKPASFGGLNWGSGRVAIALTALIVALVAYLSWSQADVDEGPTV